MPQSHATTKGPAFRTNPGSADLHQCATTGSGGRRQGQALLESEMSGGEVRGGAGNSKAAGPDAQLREDNE